MLRDKASLEVISLYIMEINKTKLQGVTDIIGFIETFIILPLQSEITRLKHFTKILQDQLKDLELSNQKLQVKELLDE